VVVDTFHYIHFVRVRILVSVSRKNHPSHFYTDQLCQKRCQASSQTNKQANQRLKAYFKHAKEEIHFYYSTIKYYVYIDVKNHASFDTLSKNIT